MLFAYTENTVNSEKSIKTNNISVFDQNTKNTGKSSTFAKTHDVWNEEPMPNFAMHEYAYNNFFNVYSATDPTSISLIFRFCGFFIPRMCQLSSGLLQAMKTNRTQYFNLHNVTSISFFTSKFWMYRVQRFSEPYPFICFWTQVQKFYL